MIIIKLTGKSAHFEDRLNHAQETVQVYEDICKHAQHDYYTEILPSVLEVH